jgi:hypothetical protein
MRTTAESRAAQSPESTSAGKNDSSVAASAVPAAGALSLDTLPACLTGLGLTGVTPLAIDHGTFKGQPADVLVFPTEDDPTTLDVYVLKPGCSASDAQFYEFAHVPVP